jgi:hypothetical protein
MRVDPPGHDIAAGRIEFGAACQVGTYGGDPAVLHLHVGLIGEVGGDDGAVTDDGGHGVGLSVEAQSPRRMRGPRWTGGSFSRGEVPAFAGTIAPWGTVQCGMSTVTSFH